LYDLKSAAMSEVIQTLGLGQPVRSVWMIYSTRIVTNGAWVTTNFFIVQRNFDPELLVPSTVINGASYGYDIREYSFPGGTTNFFDATEVQNDPTAFAGNAVADGQSLTGNYFTGLSYDDAGGLRFLYNPTNIRTEPLLSDVQITPGQIGTGQRPGINKLQLIRASVTNLTFPDRVFSNGILVTQMLTRVVSKPDILFTAEDLGMNHYSSTSPAWKSHVTRVKRRTADGVWHNASGLNANPGRDGPGIIGPGWVINFSPLGRYASLGMNPDDGEDYFSTVNWAVFNGSTNPLVQFGIVSNAPPVTLRFNATNTTSGTALVWKMLGVSGAVYRIQASTNLNCWSDVGMVTNSSGVFRVEYTNSLPGTFLRAVSP
ncbi:MAG TPA: hypothetical protein VK968_02575, partial [Roseimicrobium sp.]|nr:hypothetical protein [Roseimicrobium sp.]